MPDQITAGPEPVSPVKPFDDPVRDSAALFRRLLDAMAQPGRPVETDFPGPAPDGLNGNAFAIALTLFDHETRVYLSPRFATDAAQANIRFHCGSSLVSEADRAAFAVLSLEEAPAILPHLDVGTPDYPDRAATAIVVCGDLPRETHADLTGPGIAGSRGLAVPANEDTMRVLAKNHGRYPLGFDTFFVFNTAIVGLPRSTRVEPRRPQTQQEG